MKQVDLAYIFQQMNASAALEHVRRLDEGWASLLRGERAPAPLQEVSFAALPSVEGQFDLLYAGGGLSLLHALAMQQAGWRVLLFDERVVGATHREWNISRPEIEVLVEAGLFSWAELEKVITRQYERGFIRFHHPHGKDVEFDLPGVLDVAIDATALLALARRKLEAAGGVVWEKCRFEQAWLAHNGQARAVVRMRQATGKAHYIGAKLLVNGMGALSPLSLALAGKRLPLEGVCPTVGTVAHGFAQGEVNSQVGEILVTLEGARAGKQLIWEGFPTRDDHFTTYLFYYDTLHDTAKEDIERPHSLHLLFEQYFELLPLYKQFGPNFAHLKPVYGFIPGRHHLDGSLSQQTRTARGLLSIGDAASRQNPLTFTGFGSFVRHLPRSTACLHECLQAGDLEAETLATLSAAQSNLGAMWVMSRFLAPRSHPDDVNSIMRDFTKALAEIGPKRAADFFLDRAAWRDYVEIMLRTARHRPKVFKEAFEVLGVRGVAQWLEDLVRWKRAEMGR